MKKRLIVPFDSPFANRRQLMVTINANTFEQNISILQIMAFILSGITAADFWRRIYRTNTSPTAPCNLPNGELGDSSYRKLTEITSADWLEALLAPEQGRVHVLVRDSSKRNSNPKVDVQLWTKTIPHESFYRLTDSVFIASPAFTFLLLANKLKFGELVAYGNEICGKYGFDEREERGFRKRTVPLISVSALRAYLEIAKEADGAVYGINRAIRALNYIGDGSESPMETVQWILFRVTQKQGGYHFDCLTMNSEVQLSRKDAVIAHRSKLRRDLIVEGTNIVIEYLGKHDHYSDESFGEDRRRTNVLTKMGYEVYEVTNDQIRDWRAFETLAIRIAKATGKRIPVNKLGATPERMELRNTLFGWNASYGRPAI